MAVPNIVLSDTIGTWISEFNTLSSDVGDLSTLTTTDTSTIVAAINSVTAGVAAVSINAGSGLTGGGTIDETRTLNIGAGNYIIVNADDVAVDATSANTASKVVARDASGNFSAGTITATLSGNASTATLATTATNVTATANNATNETTYVTFVDGATGDQGIETDTGLTYNPSTNTLTTTTFSGALSGNATTATTLQTARTISLGGDVSGSASFNGSSDITITATVADDSHNHIISNVDGLQTALDSKLNLSGGTMAGLLQTKTSTVNTNTSGTTGTLEIMGNAGGGAVFSFHRVGSGAVNMGLDTDNIFRIGGWSFGANLLQMDMSGNLTMAGNVIASSDARLKENVATIDNALDKVINMRGVYYNRINNPEREIGVIAQEIEAVAPELVKEDAEGFKAVAYGNIVGLLIEAIRELNTEIELLKNAK